MSLLMDALKRAEASKQQAGQAPKPTESDTTGLSLEPLGSGNGERGQPLPDLAAHLDAVDADLEASSASMAQAAPRPAPTPSAPPSFVADTSTREAARAMFAAKAPPPPNRTGLWLALGALGLCAAGIGVYFWWQLNTLGGGSLASPSAASMQITRTTTPPAPAPVPAVPVPQPTTTATVLDRTPAASEGTAALSSTERAASAAALTRGRIAPAEYQPAPDAASNDTRVQLTRSRPAADPLILRGWQNLQAGAINAARQDYEQGLRRDPKNVDALLGLAVIANRQGRSADAEQYFMQALEADPKDAAAQAAIFGLRAQSDPSAAESRLKIALAEQPDSASLNFALGNLYAREQRWNDAQQAYFNAVAVDGNNPDYLFNLAVSLDQLRQPKLATQYYQKALEANAQRPAAFDAERVRRRVNQLTTTP